MVQTRNAAFAEESAEVEVLFAEAAKFDNISKRMKASLARLESGAQVVQDAMGPVYSNTQDLQTMNGSRSRVWPRIMSRSNQFVLRHRQAVGSYRQDVAPNRRQSKRGAHNKIWVQP